MALTGGAYESTYAVTDVVNTGSTTNVGVDNTGTSVGAVYTLLNSIITNWNLAMTATEADGATTTTYTPNNAFTTMLLQGNILDGRGMHQIDLYNSLSSIVTKFNAVLALLDADGGVTKTNYAATVNALGTGAALALPATVSGSGLAQSDLVAFLDDLVTKMNGLLAHMDTDNA